MEKRFEFKPFDKVLVRDEDNTIWEADFFSRIDNTNTAGMYSCVGSICRQCIPYNGNEHLLGTTDPYEEPKWMPKEGDKLYRPILTNYNFEPFGYLWHDNEIDRVTAGKGWALQTRAECQALCDKLNEAIKNIK